MIKVKYTQAIKDYILKHQDQNYEFLVDYDNLAPFLKLGFKVKQKAKGLYIICFKRKNPYQYTNNHKRYYTLDYYYKTTFGCKIAKIPINAGFTCPNIDGSKGYGGCSFCSTKGSGDFAGHPLDTLKKQWDDGYQMMHHKWPDAQFIAYFQAFSNTYADYEELVNKYNYFLNLKQCFGISIATRADCLNEEIVKYLAQINKIKPIWVEVGLQTIHEKTAHIINRCHDLATFEEGINLLKKYHINTIVHIINGLPQETPEMMLQTAKYVAKLKVAGIKIHLLHVLSDTRLVGQLNNNFLQLLTQEEYIKITVEQLCYLPPDMVIHRLTGDAPFATFIGPVWSKKKTNVINKIDKYMNEHGLYQGCYYED